MAQQMGDGIGDYRCMGEHVTSFAIDGKTMFEYEPMTGVLKVREGFIETLLLEILIKNANSTPDGIGVKIPLPLAEPAILKGVKKIEYLT